MLPAWVLTWTEWDFCNFWERKDFVCCLNPAGHMDYWRNRRGRWTADLCRLLAFTGQKKIFLWMEPVVNTCINKVLMPWAHGILQQALFGARQSIWKCTFTLYSVREAWCITVNFWFVCKWRLEVYFALWSELASVPIVTVLLSHVTVI